MKVFEDYNIDVETQVCRLIDWWSCDTGDVRAD